MKQQDKIPSSKVQRATRFVKTGAKVGRNYMKHYAKKVVNPKLSREALDEKNADDIYEALSELKGSALKVAQMMSMDQGVIPKAYTNKFQMAQYSAPPLSGPLVVKTFREELGKSPTEIFDTFDLNASFAASIGQVHKATKDGVDLAVKVQYPGVAASVKSDLRLVRPIASRVMKMKDKEIRKYFSEVEERLLEETDYKLELRRSMEISQACAHIPNLRFPEYFPEYSSARIITMSWLPGVHLNEFMPTQPDQDTLNQIGQALWDFTNYQMHVLGKVHADPHPGNFLLSHDGTLGVLDFGCVKEIPEDFYKNYFFVIHPEIRNNPDRLLQTAYDLELLSENDTEQSRDLVLGILTQFLDIVEEPFFQETFDFGNDEYIQKLYDWGMEVGNMKQVKELGGARGTQHALYINRTFFGLYTLLNQLNATINAQDKYIMSVEL